MQTFKRKTAVKRRPPGHVYKSKESVTIPEDLAARLRAEAKAEDKYFSVRVQEVLAAGYEALDAREAALRAKAEVAAASRRVEQLCILP